MGTYIPVAYCKRRKAGRGLGTRLGTGWGPEAACWWAEVGGAEVGGTEVGGAEVGGAEVGGTEVGGAKVSGAEVGGAERSSTRDHACGMCCARCLRVAFPLACVHTWCRQSHAATYREL